MTRDHDVGFQLNCSYGNAFRLTGNEAYKQVLYQGAKSLSTRFNPAAGVIRSWDFVRKGCDWKFPVIIDNMMNLELLLSMSKAYADDSLQNIACTHANTTIQHHFRMIIPRIIWWIMTLKQVQCAASKRCRASRTIPPGAADKHGPCIAIR